MEVIKTIKEMKEFSSRVRRAGKTIAFVPTMGYFHDGHLSLMREGRRRGDLLIVSLFVNPTWGFLASPLPKVIAVTVSANNWPKAP